MARRLVGGLNGQNLPIATFRVRQIAAMVKLGNVLHHRRDTSTVKLLAEIASGLRADRDAMDATLPRAERVFVGFVASQEIVGPEALRNRVSNAVGVQNKAGRRAMDRIVAAGKEEEKGRFLPVYVDRQGTKWSVISP